MSCYKPLEGYRRFGGGLTFNRSESIGTKLTVSCGQCLGCRLQKSQEWAARIVHESQMHEQNQFITLTYNDEHCPAYGSLAKSHFQKFMKRYRKFVQAETGQKIRFYMCGEYGDKTLRPHYHAIIFGHEFADKILYSQRGQIELYGSEQLTQLWGKGFTSTGSVTLKSAGYVARYTLKKITGKGVDKIDDKTGLRPYERFDSISGEIHEVIPEYTTMSLKPGIGKAWFDKYARDVFPDDYIIIDGVKRRTPGYYLQQLERMDPKCHEEIKNMRRKTAQGLKKDNTPERLAVRERVQRSKISNLKRTI